MGSLSVWRFLYFTASVLMASQGSNTFVASTQSPTTDMMHLLRTVLQETPRNGGSPVTHASRGSIEQKPMVTSEVRRLPGTKHEKSVDSRFGRSSKGTVLSHRRGRHSQTGTANDDSMLHLASGNLLIMAALVGVKELEKMHFWAERSEQFTSPPCALNSSDNDVIRPPGDTGRTETAPRRTETSAVRHRGVECPKPGRPVLNATTIPREWTARGKRSGPTKSHTTTLPQNLNASIKKILTRLEAEKAHGDDAELMDKVKSAMCLAHLAASHTSLITGQRWAQLMADSSAHFPAGMMDHELEFVGIVGECLDVEVPPVLGFHTKYCAVTFTLEQVRFPEEARPQKLTGLSAGGCVPDTCDTKQLEWIFAEALHSRIHLEGVQVGSVFCKQEGKEERTAPDAGASAVMAFLALWCLVVVASTIFDSWCASAASSRQPKPRRQGQRRGPSSSRYVRFQPGRKERERNRPIREEEERIRPRGEGHWRIHPGREEIERIRLWREEQEQTRPWEEEQEQVQSQREEMEQIRPWREEQEQIQPGREKQGRTERRREKQEQTRPLEEEQERVRPQREEMEQIRPWREEQEQIQPQRQEQEQNQPLNEEVEQNRPWGEEQVRQSSRHCRPDTVGVQIDTNIDSDVSTLPEPHQPLSRSIPRSPQGQRRKQIRGILLKRLDTSSLQSAEASGSQEASSLRRLVRCFSLRRNFKRLLDTSTSDKEIGCLHGLRVISLVWVVLVNSVMYQSLFTRNTMRLFRDWRRNSFQYPVIGKGNLSLESLFALSGLLVGYAYSLQLDKQMGKMKWWAYIFNRYWRIVPTLVMVAVAYVALFPYLTSGPLSMDRAPNQEACMRWGWLNVLLLQNLFAPSMCMSWTWVLAVDFQLFLLTPVLLWLLYRRPCLAYLAVLFIVLASWIANGALTRIHDLPVSQFVLPNFGNFTATPVTGSSSGTTSNSGSSNNSSSSQSLNVDDFTRLYLYKPWAHTGSFFPPLLVGYLLHRSGQRACFRTRTVVAGWVTTVAASTAVLLGVSAELVGERTSSAGALALYNAVHHTVWGLAVSWVVMACSTGYAGPVNSLLGWPGWKPFSRLVLGTYLLHPIVAMGFSACLEQLVYMTSAQVVYQFFGVLVVSLLLSTVLTLTWEMPLTALPPWLASCCVPSTS